MNKDIYYYEILNIYNKALKKYIENFSAFSYKELSIDDHEKIIVVEDSFVVYIALKDYFCDGSTRSRKFKIDNYYLGREITAPFTIIYEELTYNSIFKFNASKFKKFVGGRPDFLIYKYFNNKFDVIADEGFDYRTKSHSIYKSNFEYVNNILPQLELNKRNELWKGIPTTYVIYKLSYNGRSGFACNYTSSEQITTFIYQTINHMIPYKFLDYKYYCNHFDKRIIKDEIYYKTLNFGDKTTWVFPYSPLKSNTYSYEYINDSDFNNVWIDFLFNLYEQNHELKDPKNTVELEKYFPEGMISYYIINNFRKDYNDSVQHIIDYIKDAKLNILKYDEKNTFSPSQRRWKSEELMYKCLKEIYGNKVIFQYRPFFLKTNKGQLSYDSFILGKNIAFEYQGKQHFEPVDFFGGEEHFRDQVRRDKLKQKLSIENNVDLIYINYWENISIDLIKQKIRNHDNK